MSASLWISRASPFPVGSIRPGRPTTVPVHHPGPGLPPCASLALHGSPGHGGGGDGWSTAGRGRVRRASLEGELKSRSVAVIAAYRRYVCSCEGYREVKHFERTDQKKQPHALTRCGCMARLDVERNEGSGICTVLDGSKTQFTPSTANGSLSTQEGKGKMRCHLHVLILGNSQGPVAVCLGI